MNRRDLSRMKVEAIKKIRNPNVFPKDRNETGLPLKKKNRYS